jgi:eukaryotic-like serine/threonine-protein kinase
MAADGEDRFGELLDGRYELRDVIARGSQGFLYRARDRKDGDDVAVKLLRVAGNDPNAVERLFREAQAMTQLMNTSAVRVLDHVRAADGSIGLVMELLHGRELADELAELEASGERMPRDQIVSLFEPIVATLDAAREVGIVHRDVKPENIFVIHPAYGGGVRLLDFGFARFTRLTRITREGDIAGSPTHISPEAWAGVADLDHRADVYALAVVLFRVLAGRVPFAGTFGEIMRAVTSAPRPSLFALRPDLPPAIDDWVNQALAVDRDRRFTRTGAMWRALRSCLTG